MVKKIIIFVLLFIVSFWFWITVKPWVDSPTRFSQIGNWLTPLILLAVLASFNGLAFLLIKNRGLGLLASTAVGLPFFLIFGYSGFYLIAFVLLILLQLYAARNIRAEANERTRVDILLIMKRGLPQIIIPLLIMVSFAFFLSPNLQTAAKTKQLPPTIKQVVEKTVNGFLGEEIKSLPPTEQKQAQSQIVSQVFDQITSFLGPYFQFMPPILAFGLFLVLWGLSFVFVWLAVSVSVLTFWVLKKSGVIRIRMVPKEAEELEF